MPINLAMFLWPKPLLDISRGEDQTNMASILPNFLFHFALHMGGNIPLGEDYWEEQAMEQNYML